MDGRRVIVVGLGGIGAAVARRLVGAGASVHLVDIDDSRTGDLADELGATWTSADASNEPECERAFDEAESAMQGLDGLVCTAGGSGRRWGDGPVGTLTGDAIAQTLRLNALPPLLSLNSFVRRTADRLGPRGAVLTGSVLARYPRPEFDTHAYAFAKAGIEGLVRATASRYAAEGLQVNCVSPGLTRTPMSSRAQSDPAVRRLAAELQPLTDDGFVDPDEVAAACVWLLGSREVTGQIVTIDGGWSS